MQLHSEFPILFFVFFAIRADLCQSIHDAQMGVSLLLQTRIIRGRTYFDSPKSKCFYFFDIIAFGVESSSQGESTKVVIFLDQIEFEQSFK